MKLYQLIVLRSRTDGRNMKQISCLVSEIFPVKGQNMSKSLGISNKSTVQARVMTLIAYDSSLHAALVT
jgi:hypothetical protein